MLHSISAMDGVHLQVFVLHTQDRGDAGCAGVNEWEVCQGLVLDAAITALTGGS